MSKSLYQSLARAAEHGFPPEQGDLLKGFSSSDPHDVWMAAKASGVHRVEAMVSQLFHHGPRSGWPKDVDVASIAVWALAQIGTEDVKRQALMLSSSSDNAQRRFAADLLGELRWEEGLEALGKLLEDRDQQVSLWAALSISKFGGSGIPKLVTAGRTEQRGDRQIIIADALSRIPGNVAQQELENLLGRLPSSTRGAVEKSIASRIQ